MRNPIGQILLDQYRVEDYIASGGMGTVYRVWDIKRNVPLAMKVLHADLASDPSVYKRFRREAKALEKLAHPHIVPFYGLHKTEDFTFLLEGYVDKRLPKSALDDLFFEASIEGVDGFIYDTLVDARPGTVLDARRLRYDGPGTEYSVPRIYSTLRANLIADIAANRAAADDCEWYDPTC